jgi:hypothetical protein
VPKKISWYAKRVSKFIERDRPLRDMQEAMERLAHLQYELPKALESLEWMRTVRTTAPYDYIRAGSRALHGLTQRPAIDPVSVLKAVKGTPESEAAKAKANEWETALKWQFDRAVERAAMLREDLPRSALLYDEIVGQVIHLPSQIKAIEEMGGSSMRQKMALAHGQFAIDLENPKDVHVRYSKYMAEEWASVKVVGPQDIVDFFGKKAAKLAALIEDEKAEKQYILVDYTGVDNGKAVFCYPGHQIDPMLRAAEEGDSQIMELLVEDLKYPFSSWFAAVGGSVLESQPDRQRFPLLYGMWRAEQWVTTNIVASLNVSENIAEAAQPDFIATGPTTRDIENDSLDPAGIMHVPLGNTVQPVPQRASDPKLREMWDRFERDMGTTLPRILVTAEAMPDEPFAGYNMRLRQGLAAILPYKHLAERATAQIYERMLLWCHYSGTPITGYHKDKLYQIDSEDIDPEALYLSVTLEPDYAIDQQQRTNTAVMQTRELKRPTEDILKEMGETDPQGAMKRWAQEQIFMAELQGTLQLINAETSGQIQQMAAQMAQQMVQEQQQAQEQAQGESPAGLAPGMGQGFDPNMGGAPFAQANPGATREMQSGMTRTGEQVLA